MANQLAPETRAYLDEVQSRIFTSLESAAILCSAAANSAAGLENPQYKAHKRPPNGAFFVPASLWWAVRGAFRGGRFLVCDFSSPVQPITRCLRTLSGGLEINTRSPFNG